MGTFVGEIVAVQPTNKAGKPMTGVEDLFFKTNGEKYFIKLMECDTEVVKKLKEMKGSSVVLKIELKDGLWDTDNPEVQSRIGKYCVVKSILKR